MKKEQALQIIKQIIDEALKKGVIINLDVAQQVLIAFTTLGSDVIEKKDS